MWGIPFSRYKFGCFLVKKLNIAVEASEFNSFDDGFTDTNDEINHERYDLCLLIWTREKFSKNLELHFLE